ncbi:catechol 1,2-dioxygenase [Burkholderia sp. Ac-20353]|uniref:catechol 1,2-dioxygenase n=1 Tax=Burkholderia sp. Ac-20353 TaxID=2703894 RepID=UPI00197C8DAC|nr:catechol 1,2-dioxygenase [Burkholderia sp. Ac-20353]MBN3788821.1 catechol 1,2-dioxygenase [Burkholderia sp. Ac-20353]
MSKVVVKELAYVRLRSPDLDLAETFLKDFGLSCSARTASALYMRGTDSAHHIHVTEKGEAKFIGFAFEVANEEDLECAARLAGASTVHEMDEPGGGSRVILTEPNGYQIELVHGIEHLEPIPVEQRIYNTGEEPLRRAGVLQRLPASPTKVKRIGHCVFTSAKWRETTRWFHENLGLLATDDVYAGEPSNVIATFSRLDRGPEYVDHHVFMCFKGEECGFNHVSFEVNDIDAVMADHQHLKELGKYEHMWGVGRHLLGSQVFDYWSDPWGRIHEHWADSDRLNVEYGSKTFSVEEGFVAQWGEHPPERFLRRVSK